MILRMMEDAISSSNVAARIASLGRLRSNYDDEISFVVSHFFEMSASSLESMNYNVLKDIVYHGEQKLTNEESHFELLLKQIDSLNDDCF
jgi:hypothetical protein